MIAYSSGLRVSEVVKMKIRQIIDKIDENQLFVPAFQREYVWKRDDAKRLIASLIKDYPTGTMLSIKAGKLPLYCEFSDKNGSPQKKFYIRSGNSSQELDIQETASYIKNRFN